MWGAFGAFSRTSISLTIGAQTQHARSVQALTSKKMASASKTIFPAAPTRTASVEASEPNQQGVRGKMMLLSHKPYPNIAQRFASFSASAQNFSVYPFYEQLHRAMMGAGHLTRSIVRLKCGPDTPRCTK